MLKNYCNEWIIYKNALVIIADIFNYLEQCFIMQFISVKVNPSGIKQESPRLLTEFSTKGNLMEVFMLGLFNWDKYLLRKCRSILIPLALDIINEERIHSFNLFKNYFYNAKLDDVSSDNDIISIKSILPSGNDTNLVEIFFKSILTLGRIPLYKYSQLYHSFIETPYLFELTEFYSEESNRILINEGISRYLHYSTFRILDECNRAQKFLGVVSRNPIETNLNKTFLFEIYPTLMLSFEDMMERNAITDLHRLYRLSSRLMPCVPELLEAVYSYIVNVGTSKLSEFYSQITTKKSKYNREDDNQLDGDYPESKAQNDTFKSKSIKSSIINDPKLQSTMYVDIVISLHLRFIKIIKNAFSNDPKFVDAMSKAFHKIINLNPTGSEASELLARYTDLLLRKSNQNLPESVIEEKIKQAVLILCYMDSKDIFQRLYSNCLARRLIYGTSISEDSEKIMIFNLKEIYGYDFSSKLKRMFQDILISSDLNKKFHSWIAQNPSDPFESYTKIIHFEPLVLMSGAWPLRAYSTDFKLPQEIQQYFSLFESFYFQVHESRKLIWLHHFGRGEIQTFYTPSVHTIQGNSFQIAVLLLFNTSEKYSLEQIANLVDLSQVDLHRTIRGLITANFILVADDIKDPEAKTEKLELNENKNNVNPKRILSKINPQTIFELNLKYSNKKVRVKIIPFHATPETSQQLSEVQNKIEYDRSVALKATVVRIMKSRKNLSHNELISLVISQCKSLFNPKVAGIKRAIEYLIEQEFLKKDGNFYIYLA